MTQPHTARPAAGDVTENSDPQERGAAVAHDAKDEASAVAGTAQEQAGRVADEARAQARDLTEDAREQLRQQAETQTDHLGEVVSTLGERVQALADGRPEDAGPIGDVTERIASQVQQIASRVDELGFEGSVQELQRFARRRPGAFLAGAAALGFAASRLAQGVKADKEGSSDRASSDRADRNRQPTLGTDPSRRDAPQAGAPSDRGSLPGQTATPGLPASPSQADLTTGTSTGPGQVRR